MDNKFTQLCVMPATTLDGQTPKDFEDFIKDNFGCRVKFCEQVITLPDKENGHDVPETGGRSDLLFYIHQDDIPKFAIKRFAIDVRWWEDVVKNRHHLIYPQSIIEKYPKTW
jgi:hypothetical protein